MFRKPSNRPVKLKKHKVIAKAFEKRKELNNGRLSISFASTHEDPLGKTSALFRTSFFLIKSMLDLILVVCTGIVLSETLVAF